jgi:hypothetical protein
MGQSVNKFGINSVIPAQAGIQMRNVKLVSLDSGFRRSDEKTKLVDGLSGRLPLAPLGLRIQKKTG